jgi:hypothetical protein
MQVRHVFLIACPQWDGKSYRRMRERNSKLDESFLRGALRVEIIPGPIPSFPVDENVGLLHAEGRVIEVMVNGGWFRCCRKECP